LSAHLTKIFGDQVECQFIDIRTDAIKNLPEVEKYIHQVLLPVTLINGIPQAHGFLDLKLIVNNVSEQLNKIEQ